ncbi:hypothetical protein [Methylobacterium sp. ARG-1]|uniref:hypothetical protein n=1 Tax=Methylobacterium sp. ARG-1 TaxID=1692501 RepID=UPI0006815752|nr:hypothetical protein [Methylobacterium sp. ARG-1]KNY23626.1 hypothetical protein AKJ13_03800 [Methylobacterium sp. ARG-1]
MRLIAVVFIGLATVATVPARASGDDATQRMLDAMTRHDLCARDDAQLRKLNRSLAATPIRHPASGTRAR